MLGEYYENILNEYIHEKGYHPNTNDDVVWIIRRFLYYFEQINHYSMLTVEERYIRQYIITMSEKLSNGSLKNMMCYLKTFCSYAYEKGYSEYDFSGLFSVKIRRTDKIKAVLTDEEVERMVAAIDTSTVMGKRDMAMMQLGITVGLRGIDIINLKLTDIDWIKGEIHLIQSKTGQPIVMPLMKEAGEAIKDYIINARPAVSSEYIFMSVMSPIRKLNNETGLEDMFDRYAKKAGIERKPFDGKSFHSFRRRLATKMVRAGVPVTTISQALGHVNIESSKQYLMFDSDNLKRCALNFQGIALKEDVFCEE